MVIRLNSAKRRELRLKERKRIAVTVEAPITAPKPVPSLSKFKTTHAVDVEAPATRLLTVKKKRTWTMLNVASATRVSSTNLYVF